MATPPTGDIPPGNTPPDTPSTDALLAALDEAGRRILTLAGPADLTTPVPACPDWDLAGLLGHLGTLWWFHTGHLARGVSSPPDPATRPEPPDGSDLLPWAVTALDQLLAVLTDLPADFPAWNWAHQPPTVAFWQKRMAHESLVHRRDVEQALGAALTPYGPLAPDGLAELLSVFLPRSRHREPWAGPTGQLGLDPTDGSPGWLLRVGAGRDLEIQPWTAPGPPTVLAGTAEQLLLAGWGRGPLGPLLRTGDLALAAGFLAE